jgi:hypothetical protein
MWNWLQNVFSKVSEKIIDFYLSCIGDFIASQLGHFENIGSLSYADLINGDAFQCTI